MTTRTKPISTAKNKDVTFSTFEIADHLNNETVIAKYLSLAAQDANSDVLLMANADVVKARELKMG